jgi:hypothetical protein
VALSILPSADYYTVKQELRIAIQQVVPKLTELVIELVEGDEVQGSGQDS